MAKKHSVPIDKDEPWEPSDTCDVPIAELLKAVKAERTYSYDLETSGLSPRKHRIEGVAFYVPNEKDPTRRPVRAWYPFTDGTMDHTTNGVVTALREPMSQVKIMEQLREVWSIEDVIAIRHNGIFDDAFLYLSSGLDDPIIIKNIIADSMLADYIADERHRRYGLKIRVEQVFGHKMTTYNEAIGAQALFGFANKKPLGVYAVDDCAWTYRLWKWAMNSIRLQDPPREHGGDWCSPMDDTPGVYSDLEKIYWKIEMKIQRILMEMEITGCFIDWEWLVKVQERVNKEQEEILAEFKKTVGWVPNLRSPKQVSDFLYKPTDKGGLGLPTKGVDYNEDLDQYATGDKAISHRKAAYPLVGKMLKYRSLSVIDNSFCKKLIKLAQEEGRVYARFRQTGTVIGRLSCLSGMSMLSIRLNGEDLRHLVKLSELCQFAGSDVMIITHKGRERRVLNLFNKGPDLMFEVVADDGSKIRCTRDHKFFTDSGWRALKDIKRGDRLLRAEVCEAQEGREGSEVGAGSSVVPQGVRGRPEAGLQEVENLRVIGWDRDHVQGGLRMGDRCISGSVEPSSGSGRDTSDYSDVGATGQVQRLHSLQGVVQGDLCRQRPDAGEGEEDLRGISPGHDSGRENIQGVSRRPGGEARTTSERSETEGRGVLLKVDIDSRDVNRSITARNRRQARSRRVHHLDGYVPSRSIGKPSWNHVVGEPIDGQRVLGPGRIEPTSERSAIRPEVGLHRASRGLSEADAAGPFGQAERVDHAGPDRERDDREGSPNVCFKSVGDETVPRADGSWNLASTPVQLLQELAGRFCVARIETTGRGRWRVAPDVRRHQGSGSEENKEGEGSWLPSGEVYYEADRQEPSYGDPQDRVRTWTRITSITPVSVEDVWDLTVEGDHSYLAHGFVNKNSADPVNLMNQPRDKDLIRKAFCAHLIDDHDLERRELCLLDADYAQMELRMAAHLAKERNMIEVYTMVGGCKAGTNGDPCDRYTFFECFKCHVCKPPVDTPDGPKCADCGAHGDDIEHQKRCRHVDLHQRTAEDVGVPRNPLAKNSNFGLLYRMGAPKFCVYAGLHDADGSPRVEYGQELIDKWHVAYPGIAPWHARVLRKLVADNYIAYNITRRRRRLDVEWKKNDYRAGTQAIQFRVSGCVVPLTAILTENGYVEIEKLLTEKVPIFDGVGFTGDYDVIDSGTKEVLKVTLASGRALTCSADHRFAIMNGLSMDWSKLSELSVGDMVATHNILAPYGEDDHGASVDDAYLVGALIGDGYYGSSQGFTLAASAREPGWPESLEASVFASQGEIARKKTRWGLRKTNKGGLVKDLVCNSSRVRANLMILGLDCVSKQDKRIPEWAYTSAPEIRAAVLAGLFDTDGSVLSYKQKTYTSLTIQYSSRVKALVDGAWKLASSLGIECGVRAFDVEQTGKAGGRTVQYRLDVSYRGFQAFNRWVELRHPRKAATLAGALLLIAKRAPRREFPPSYVRAIAELAEGSPVLVSRQGASSAFDDRKLRRRVQTYIGHARGGHAGQNMIETVLDYIDEAGHKQVLGYGWSRIVSIETMGISPAYDIEIHGDNHAYIADGFFTHNSCQDIIKLSMVKIYDYRNQKVANSRPAEAKLWDKFRAMIQVHDELIFEGPKSLREELCVLIKACMEDAGKGMRVPFIADCRAGRCWDDLH